MSKHIWSLETARQQPPLNGASCYFWSVLSTCILWTVSRTPPLALRGSCATDKQSCETLFEIRDEKNEALSVWCIAEVDSAGFHQISSFHWPEDYWYLTNRELECFCSYTYGFGAYLWTLNHKIKLMLITNFMCFLPKSGAHLTNFIIALSRIWIRADLPVFALILFVVIYFNIHNKEIKKGCVNKDCSHSWEVCVH